MFRVEESIGFLLARASRLISNQLVKNFKDAELPISLADWIVMIQLWQEDGISQQTISNRSGVAKPNITTYLDQLEKQGMVVRVPHPDDRRTFKICLTAKGKKLKEKAIQQALATNEKALEGLTPEEKRILHLALNRSITNLL